MDKLTLTTKVDFKIIPFDDALWRTVFPQLKEQFGIEQINIVESRLFFQHLSITTMYMWTRL